MNRILQLLLYGFLGAGALVAAEAPEFTPRLELYADFTGQTRCPVFKSGEKVELCVRIRGRRSDNATLSAAVSDWRGNVVHSESRVIPKGGGYRDIFLTLPDRVPGCYQVSLTIPETGTTVPRQGTRPAGFVTYAVLPDIAAAPLADATESRFGAQGFARIDPDDTRDILGKTYEWAGLRWIYLNRRLFDLAGSRDGEFDPDAPGAEWIGYRDLEHSALKRGCTVFSDLNSIPAWLQNVPDGVDTSKWTASASHYYQIYAPKDFGRYAELVGRVAKSQRAMRQKSLPGQKRGIYEIHWEPDWHWKGTDAEFVKMYEFAQQGIRANDPEGELLGANYGVLKTGNDHLERLFKLGLGKYLDGIVTHLYYLPMNRSPEEAGVIEELRRLIDLKKRYLRPGARAINSEWGIQCSTAFGKTLHNDPSLVTRELAWLLRGHLIALGEGLDTTFFFYLADHGEWGLFFNLQHPYPSFTPQRIAPKPTFSGVAAMTRLLEGSKNLGCIDYLTPGAWGYAFASPLRTVAALWSRDEQPRRVHFPVGVPRVTLRDAMGNARVIETPGGVAAVDIDAIPVYVEGFAPGAIPRGAVRTMRPTVAAGPRESWKFQRAELIGRDGKPVPIAAGGTLPSGVSAGRYTVRHASGIFRADVLPKIELKLTEQGAELRNRLDSPAEATLTVAGLPPQKLRLSPREKRSIPLDYSVLPPESAANRTIRGLIRDGDGAETRAALSLENRYPILPFARAPKIDGNLDDWNLERFTTVHSESAVKIGLGAWRGPADLSLRYAVGRDARGLYFAFRVRDDRHRQTRDALNSWAEDSIQLGLGVDRDAKKGWNIYTKLCFAQNSRTGEPLSYRHNGTGDGCPPGELKNRKIEFAFSRNGDESRYEIFVPWEELSKTLTAAPAGPVGIGILVNDVDDRPDGVSRRRALEVFGGMAEGDPRRLGTALLK